MSQGELNVPSGSGLSVRTGFNDALERLATKGAGVTRPADIKIFETWLETDNPGGGIATLWMWDGTSDIPVGLVNSTSHTFTPVGPTQSTSDDSSKMATTAHVKDMLETISTRGYLDTDSTGYSLSSSFSVPMTITEGIELFSHSYTAPNGNVVLVAVDVANCGGTSVAQALSVFIDGATNAAATSKLQFTNLAFHQGVNRLVYSYVSDGTSTDIEIRVAGGGAIGTAVLVIQDFGP